MPDRSPERRLPPITADRTALAFTGAPTIADWTTDYRRPKRLLTYSAIDKISKRGIHYNRFQVAAFLYTETRPILAARCCQRSFALWYSPAARDKTRRCFLCAELHEAAWRKARKLLHASTLLWAFYPAQGQTLTPRRITSPSLEPLLASDSMTPRLIPYHTGS